MGDRLQLAHPLRKNILDRSYSEQTAIIRQHALLPFIHAPFLLLTKKLLRMTGPCHDLEEQSVARLPCQEADIMAITARRRAISTSVPQQMIQWARPQLSCLPCIPMLHVNHLSLLDGLPTSGIESSTAVTSPPAIT